MIKKFSIVFILIISLLLGFFSFILYTSAGLGTALHLYNIFLPGKFQYTSIQGPLIKRIQAQDIQYTIAGVTLSAKTLTLDWNGWHFLKARETPIKLHLQNFDVHSGRDFAHLETAFIAGKFSLFGNSTLSVQINDTQAPLLSYLNLHSKIIHGEVTGNYNDYQAIINLDLDGTNVPQGIWKIQAKGNTAQLSQVILNGDTLKGKLTLQGKLDWLPHFDWQASISGTNLHFEEQWPNYKAILSGGIYSDGSIINHKLAFSFLLKKITGFFQHQPFSAQGGVTYQADKLSIQSLAINSHNASIYATGKVDQEASVHMNVDIADLSYLVPEWSGSLSMRVQTNGDHLNPRLQASFHAEQIRIQNYSLAKGQGEITGALLAPQPLKGSFSLSELSTGSQKIDQATIEFNRVASQYHVSSILEQAKRRLRLAAIINQLESKEYVGKISDLSLESDTKNVLYLLKPINLSFSPVHIQIQPACLQSNLGETCIQQANIEKDVDGKIQGKIELSSNDLSFIQDLYPKINNASGKLNINMAIAGTIQEPSLDGFARLNQGSVSIPILGLDIKNMDFRAEAKSSGVLSYQGSLQTNNILRINGQTDFRNNLQTKLTIKGDNIQIINNNDANILISPDLLLDTNKEKIEITGSIKVPFANITPADFTTTLSLPKDVVYLGTEEETKKPTNFYSNIDLLLGDDIRFEYSGMKAKLGGRLTLTDKPGGDTTATGTLIIEEGKYTAYGQDLTIRNGKLIYTGGSVTNPGLNIEAIRQLQLVSATNNAAAKNLPSHSSNTQIVGVRIAGNLMQPKVTLFSEPSGLSQSDILSYLVLGRGTTQATSADAGTLLNALSFLNVGEHQENTLRSQLNHALGLNVSLGSGQQYDATNQSVVQNTSLVLGKALSPKVYFNYSVGLLDPINVLTATYKLSESFNLQSEHSTMGNGVDIFYHYSRD